MRRDQRLIHKRTPSLADRRRPPFSEFQPQLDVGPHFESRAPGPGAGGDGLRGGARTDARKSFAIAARRLVPVTDDSRLQIRVVDQRCEPASSEAAARQVRGAPIRRRLRIAVAAAEQTFVRHSDSEIWTQKPELPSSLGLSFQQARGCRTGLDGLDAASRRSAAPDILYWRAPPPTIPSPDHTHPVPTAGSPPLPADPLDKTTPIRPRGLPRRARPRFSAPSTRQ